MMQRMPWTNESSQPPRNSNFLIFFISHYSFGANKHHVLIELFSDGTEGLRRVELYTISGRILSSTPNPAFL